MIYTFHITPMGKPRMTQRDKWEKTRTAQADRYFVYKDSLQMLQLQNKFVPTNNMKLAFYIPKRSIFKEIEHMLKPDIDNLVKGFLDSVMENDATVWHIDAYKYWCSTPMGRIEVEHLK